MVAPVPIHTLINITLKTSAASASASFLTFFLRELSVLSESKDGAMIADHIKDVYYDRTQVATTLF